MANLILIRHGQSEWNEKNLFTGWKDPGLTDLGIKEAINAGNIIKEKKIIINKMYTSNLYRAQKTGKIILEALDLPNLPIIKNPALNERDYGDLSGLNKDDARKKWGEEQVHIWRRSFDVPPPGGESLKMTAERVIPYFKKQILPDLKNGINILIAAHGNSLRSLIMFIEDISANDIVKFEVPTGAPILYKLNSDGSLEEKINLI
jgi:2,3-bisphosphoglycerate-dependent phosphoglycerate mutase